ncbi:MAG: CHASE2 domain-containing protein [Nitrospiraceae bacterium]
MPAWPHSLRSLPMIGLLIGLLAGLGCIGLRHAGSLQPLEMAFYDWMLRIRPADARPDPRIVLIAITEDDIRSYGRWPISDATLAEALERLLRARPRVVGLDIYRDLPVQPGHKNLEALLLRRPEIIGVMKLGEGRAPTIPPPPVLRDTGRVGFSDIIVDDDGVVRRGLLYQDAGENTVPAFALQVTLRYLEADRVMPQPDPAMPDHLRLGRTTLVPFEATDGGYAGADARGYQILLDYRSARAKPATFTLSALLAGQVEQAVLEGRIVLIGVEASSTERSFATPFLVSDGEVSGVRLHAELVQQLLRAALQGKGSMTTTAEWQETLATLLLGLLGGTAGLRVRSPLRFVMVTGGGVLALGAAAWLAFLQGYWLPAVQPALAWLVSFSTTMAAGFQYERRQRDQLMQLFAQHVSPEVAEELWQKRDQFLDGHRPRPQKMIATVLFSDLQGYTSVAEGLEPQRLLDWINSYLAALTDVIIAHHGVIDDYAGDGIKANFGVPLPRGTAEEIQDDARRAVRCALALREVLERLNAQSQSRGLPTVGMRIGICSGPVVAGSLGSAQRLKYTTIGDTVNSAARLESLDKDRFVPTDPSNLCHIMIDETTAGYLTDQFRLERVGEVSVKGKERPLIAYRVMGHTETAGVRL